MPLVGRLGFLFLFPVGRRVQPGQFPEGFAEMELIGIADPFPDFAYRKPRIGQQPFSLVDSYIGQVFQRRVPFVSVEKLCEVSRGKT